MQNTSSVGSIRGIDYQTGISVEMESGELLLILLLLVGSYFPSAAEEPASSKNFQRDEDHGIFFANFEKHNYHRLLSSSALSSTTEQVSCSLDCAEICLQQPWCWSYNFKRTADEENKFVCESLSIDKYNNSEDLRPSKEFDHFSIMNPCAQSPCKNGGRCIALYEKNDFLCVCPEQFQGRYCEEKKLLSNCKEIFQVHGEKEDKVYPLLVDSGQIQVYCHMSDIPGCGGGGWTLVMKIDGSKTTFSYGSSYWSEKNTFNLAGGLTGVNGEETKLPTYWNTSFTKICLGMKVSSDLRFIVLQKNAPSLYSLIASGNFQATSLTRATWKSLIGSSSLQVNCNKEGFNTKAPAQTQFDAKARIGFIGNQESDCNTPDSVIGFGMGNYPFGKSCGNGARANLAADNGEQDIEAMCFIFVQ